MELNDLKNMLRNVDGNGNQFTAKCPAHDDKHNSLSVSEGEKGLLLHCHAGCSLEKICEALGIEQINLFNDKLDKKSNVKSNIEYIYTDEKGNPIHKSVRTPEKKFFQSHYENGKWIKGVKYVETYPYNLPTIIDAVEKNETVYIVEGEKDADNLKKIGLTATTNAAGAGKWKENYNKYFKNANVVILPDNDEPGKQHANLVYEHLKKRATTIKIVELPDLPPKGDVSDWLAKGGNKEELLSIVNKPIETKLVPTNTLVTCPTKKIVWLDEVYSAATRETTFKVNETAFVSEIMSNINLFCINGVMYGEDGQIPDEHIMQIIQSKIEPYIVYGQSRKVIDIYKALCLKAYYKPQVPAEDEIYFKNISIKVTNEGLKRIESPDFAFVKIQHNLDKQAQPCLKWEYFLECMLRPDDILTVQEYIGYCFLPTTAGQVALFIKSGGGEGKSALITVLQHIFVENHFTDKLQSAVTDKFSIATLEDKLIFLDDDMNTAGITDTGTFKSIVTSRGTMSIEKKGKDKRQGNVFARFFCVGNSDITSLFDHSDAFYERLLPLTTKGNKFRNSKNENVNLVNELIEEIPGIITWALNGLLRLHKNGYKFTISAETKANLDDIRLSNDSVIAFLYSNYIEFSKEYSCHVSELQASYEKWCDDNGEMNKKGFSGQFKQLLSEYKENPTLYDKNVKCNSKTARGYYGLRVSIIGKPVKIW